MQRALDLAKLGRGHVSPNPMVGAVLVHQDRIVGEGWHKKFGGPHAEVEAVASVVDQSVLKHSTMYVTLEPCNHHGKTPPCTDLILKHNIKSVVVAMEDPNPLVAGKGIAKLRQMGVEVQVGILEEKSRRLNKRFITSFTKRRPYVILKWAQSSDGFIAPSLHATKEEKQISGSLSNILTHKWRSEEDAIMVGFNTLVHDKPSLTIRNWESYKQLLRITLDERVGQQSIPWSQSKSIPSIVFNYEENKHEEALEHIKLEGNSNPIEQLLSLLWKRGIGSLIVEGGTGLLNQFISYGIWDEARIGTSKKILERGIPAPYLFGNVSDKIELEGDVWEIILNPQGEIAR